MSSAIREPAVAGMFYPDDPEALHAAVHHWLEEHRSADPPPKAVIAPHAGYMYSGAIAASAYARVANGRGTITRVVLLGPSHRVPVEGLAASGAHAFRTPLGLVPVDTGALQSVLSLPQVQRIESAHAYEHSLEVHLPFLQEALGKFSLVPLVVGDASAEDVAEVLDRLWDGPETLIVVSSDLSHYHDYQTARRLDQATSNAILALKPEAIHYEQACGRNPVNGLLLAARRHGLHAELLDLRNSGDTAGPRDQVVGYGAYVFH
ncbi:MAG TPA: AmmeMemoRadiSam system protein B [Gammaproteobacteria bacterium]|nr:AmmeMemoRadiSam system protein B [Gammaproteobacteria bacterium]